jgi:quercetin dioxygenase-like cupin family protein
MGLGDGGGAIRRRGVTAMDVINAIAKVRFASAKPQRVHLTRGESCAVEMVCMEAGQAIHGIRGAWAYYVVTGTARVEAGDKNGELAAGQMAAAEGGETHSLANAGDGRLICLAIGPGNGR